MIAIEKYTIALFPLALYVFLCILLIGNVFSCNLEKHVLTSFFSKLRPKPCYYGVPLQIWSE